MQIRLIEENTPNLPANFAVVAGKTVAEGIKNMAEAFARPGVNLVVWDGAAELCKPEDRAQVEALVLGMRPSHSGLSAHPERRLQDVFTIAKRRPEARAAIEALFDTTLDVQRAVASMYGDARLHEEFLKVQKTPGKPDYHRDPFNARDLIMLRTLYGDATFFADEKDSLPHVAMEKARVKPGTTTLWTPRQWAAVFLCARDMASGVIHTTPFRPGGGDKRGIDLTAFRTHDSIFPNRP
jgi:hypothetical protein